MEISRICTKWVICEACVRGRFSPSRIYCAYITCQKNVILEQFHLNGRRPHGGARQEMLLYCLNDWKWQSYYGFAYNKWFQGNELTTLIITKNTVYKSAILYKVVIQLPLHQSISIFLLHLNVEIPVIKIRFLVKLQKQCNALFFSRYVLIIEVTLVKKINLTHTC